MKKYMIVLLTLLSFSALASLHGEWSGWGAWKYDGSGVSCHTSLIYKETATKLIRKPTVFDCQVAYLNILGEAWDKKEGKLMKDGEIVGTYDENHYTLSEQYTKNVEIKSDILLNGNNIYYKELWYEQGTEIYEITGRLFRKTH